MRRPDSAAHRPQEETFNWRSRKGVITSNQITIDEGNRVSLRVFSNRPHESHLHGYNVGEVVVPGEPVEFSFDAMITGRFEVEDGKTREELGVRIVQPR